MIQDAKTLLEILTQRIPPGTGQRHRIELDENGNLEVCFFLGERYLPITLEETDLVIPINVLVDDLCNLVRDAKD